MSRQSKGARLWLRPERTSKDGKLISRSSWLILDGGKHIATGCAPSEIAEAEERLSQYIAAKYAPPRRDRDLDQIDIADVLSIYLDDCGDRQARREKLEERIGRLNAFWGGKPLSFVSGESCRAYEISRGSGGGSRRDLEDLRAAINHHAKQGHHRGSVVVTLPQKGLPKDRWLTRDEAARLLWICWRTREEQRAIPTAKFPLRHIARFILIGLYTGTRATAIAQASPYRADGRAYVDLDHGIFYRLAVGKRASKKRQTPVPIPPRLLPHMKRWAKLGGEHFIEWHGKPVASVKTGFGRAVELAKLSDVTPHTLRHTAATWLMQNRVSIWDAAGFLGMSPALIEKTYGHHHPDHLKDAAMRIGYRRQSLAVSLVPGRKDPKDVS